MESEKVKEIKEALKQNDGSGMVYEVDYKKRTCKFIHHEDILTLINELESENERLRKCREVDYKTMTALRQANTELNECMDEMQDRIAELEKENALIKSSVAMRDYKTLEEIINNRVKQFAEMLKEKMDVREYMGVKYKQGVFSENDIDETLKEYENERRAN